MNIKLDTEIDKFHLLEIRKELMLKSWRNSKMKMIALKPKGRKRKKMKKKRDKETFKGSLRSDRK